MKYTIILFSLFAIVAIIGAIIIEVADRVTEKVPCYDVHNNKINELTCDMEVIKDSNTLTIALCFIAIGFIGCILSVALGDWLEDKLR